MEENNIKTTEIAKQDDNKKTKTTKVSDQKLNWGFWILSFFLPILGYIFYLVWQTKKTIKVKILWMGLIDRLCILHSCSHYYHTNNRKNSLSINLTMKK